MGQHLIIYYLKFRAAPVLLSCAHINPVSEDHLVSKGILYCSDTVSYRVRAGASLLLFFWERGIICQGIECCD